ncbi:MAG: disulfide bond formation protein B [Alphaproteobacteria bacterium]
MTRVPLTSVPLLVVLAGSFLALAGAWASEWGLGLPPCDLCYAQRYAYWAAMAFAAFGLLIEAPIRAQGIMAQGIMAKGRPALRALALVLAIAGVAASGGLAVYHAGVEWHWWPGPGTCSGTTPLPETLDDFSALLTSEMRVVACDEAPLRVFGLSLAGLNALYALGLIIVTGVTAWRVAGQGRTANHPSPQSERRSV